LVNDLHENDEKIHMIKVWNDAKHSNVKFDFVLLSGDVATLQRREGGFW